MNNIQKGSIEVVNPIYRQNKCLIKLDTDHVRWIVFWSRNYAHFLKNRSFFDPYELFFHFTILPKSKLEKALISSKTAIKQLEKLCQFFGPDRIIWRFDPLLFWAENKTVQTNFNQEQFETLCREAGSLSIKRCYISFAQSYKKFVQRFGKRFPKSKIINLSFEKQREILSSMILIADKWNLKLFSCCNDRLLNIEGMYKGRCIDGRFLNSLVPEDPVSRAAHPTREDCGCTHSIDIGDYQMQPCPAGCIYCYANPIWDNEKG